MADGSAQSVGTRDRPNPLPHPPLPGRPATAQILRSYLRDVGYTEAGCRDALGLRNVRKLATAIPLEPQGVLTEPPGTALGALVNLFFWRWATPEDVLRRVVATTPLDALIAAGVLGTVDVGSSSCIRASLAIFPCRGLLVVTDWPVVSSRGNPVMAIHPPTYDFVEAMSCRNVSAALDLCTGSGVYALLTSRYADRVVGVDNSPRAVEFARFSAWLNRIDNVEFLQGDLYEPLSNGAGFGLVVANPPYNPTLFAPAGGSFWSGGRSGEGVLRPLLQGLPSVLADDGLAQVLTYLADRVGDNAYDRVERWVGPTHEVAFRMDDVVDPITRLAENERNISFFEPLRRIARFARSEWTRQGIVGFKFGLLDIRRRAPGPARREVRPYRRAAEDRPPPPAPLEPLGIPPLPPSPELRPVPQPTEPVDSTAAAVTDDDAEAHTQGWNTGFEQVLRQHVILPDDETMEPNHDLPSLGLDSLDAVSLIAALEEQFGVRFPDEALSPEIVQTPATLWAAVCRIRASSPPPNRRAGV
ncbi:MAG: phosphopantetheine-binding protein [Acidimicrobiales bacterium]